MKERALPASEATSKSSPAILSEHKTIAVFKGFRITSLCNKLTANCPYKCGSTFEKAFFNILEYTQYKQNDPNAGVKKETISFSVRALPNHIKEKITLEDKVRLHWIDEANPDVNPNQPKKGLATIFSFVLWSQGYKVYEVFEILNGTIMVSV